MKAFQPTIFGEPQLEMETVHQDDNCEVVRRGDTYTLLITKSWQDEMAEVARRYNVTSLTAMTMYGWDGGSVDFLGKLLQLRRMHISPDRSLDWRALELHPNVEHIMLWPNLPVYPPSRIPQGEIDFARIRRLVRCNIPCLPEWDSIRECNRLTSLTLRGWPEVRVLDLSRMHGLQELALESFVELRRVILPEDATIRSLKISQSRKLKVDLKRFVRDVEYLWLEGRLAFSLDDLGEAEHVKHLELTFLKNRAEIPPFLNKLGRLERLLTVQTRLSAEDRAVELERIASFKQAWERKAEEDPRA
jgi:hypothetical protein